MKMLVSKRYLGTLSKLVRDVCIFSVKIAKVNTKKLFSHIISFLGVEFDHVYEANKNLKLLELSFKKKILISKSNLS